MQHQDSSAMNYPTPQTPIRSTVQFKTHRKCTLTSHASKDEIPLKKSGHKHFMFLKCRLQTWWMAEHKHNLNSFSTTHVHGAAGKLREERKNREYRIGKCLLRFSDVSKEREINELKKCGFKITSKCWTL